MRPILVHYEWVLGDEVLKDSYIRYIDNYNDIMKISNSLFDDPHVVHVWFQEVE